MNGIWQDVRYALRGLGKSPSFAIVVVLTLALGIGANAAIFSIVNGLILRGLPVREPEQLVTLTSETPLSQGRTPGWNYATWLQLRERASHFDGALAWSLPQTFNLAQGGEIQTVDGVFASGEFFDTLGVPALIGRTFTIADDVKGGGGDGAIAVISYRLWQTRFSGSADVISSSITIDRVPVRIVGVLPPSFFGAEVGQAVDVILPIGNEPLIHSGGSWLGPAAFLRVILRLRGDQSPASAEVLLRSMQPQIREGALPAKASPRLRETFLKEPFTLVAASDASRLRYRYERSMLAVFGVVLLVLLIACANIANLQLARAEVQHYDFTMRMALGASPWRLARQSLIESLMLAGGGGALGIAAAGWIAPALVGQLRTYFERNIFLDVSPDWRVIGFSLAVTVGTALAFGLMPAFKAASANPIEAAAGHERASDSGGRFSVSNGLVIGQLSLTLVLVMGAGLFLGTFRSLATRPLGFDRGQVLLVYADISRVPGDASNRVQTYGRLIDSISAVPGVADVGVSMITPVSGLGMTEVVETAAATGLSSQERTVEMNVVSPGWFASYGIPLREGRDFDSRDSQDGAPVVIVNEAFAETFLPAGGAIDATVTNPTAAQRGQPSARRTVIGIVGDTAYRSVRDEMKPTMYVPLEQLGGLAPQLGISVRSSGPTPATLEGPITAALQAISPDLTFSFLPLSDQVSASFLQERLLAQVSSFFGGLALLLAAIGLYGVAAQSVARRRREIGIRMALGSAPAGVVRLVLGRMTVLVLIGLLTGSAISLWTARFVASLLYGLEARELGTLLTAAGTLAGVTAIAAALPAVRASRIDPAIVLRSE